MQRIIGRTTSNNRVAKSIFFNNRHHRYVSPPIHQSLVILNNGPSTLARSLHSNRFHSSNKQSEEPPQMDEEEMRRNFEETLRVIQQKSKQQSRAFILPTTVLALLTSASLALGVLIVDYISNNSNNSTFIFGDNVDLLDEQENKDELPIMKYWKHLKKDIQRFPALYAIIGLNTAVFLFIRFRGQSSALIEHLILSPAHVLVKKRFHTLVTSAFTHYGGLHLALNMYAVYSMGPLLLATMGTPTFLAFYFSAAIFSSFGSLLGKLLLGNFLSGSIGASGAVFALLAAGISLMPEDAAISLIFLPGFSFDPKIFFPIYLCCEVIFNLVQSKVKIDTAGHVSGALFGYLMLTWLMRQEHHNKPRRVSIYSRNYHYAGELVRFRKQGYGKLTTSNGSSYTGQFQNDKFNGQGELISRQFTYSGEFKNGMFDGKGNLTIQTAVDPLGRPVYKTVQGLFREGKPVNL